MKAFSNLLDQLGYAPGRNAKIALLAEYFQTTPDPDRGFALAALNEEMALGLQGRKLLLELSQLHISEELYRLSRDYVGDSAETLSLIWPDRSSGEAPRLAFVIAQIGQRPRNAMLQLVAHWLDNLDVNGRWALLKLLTGAMRTGVSGRLSKLTLAQAFDKDVEQIEQIWHGLKPHILSFSLGLKIAHLSTMSKMPSYFARLCCLFPSRTRILKRLILHNIKSNGSGTVSVFKFRVALQELDYFRAPAMISREAFQNLKI